MSVKNPGFYCKDYIDTHNWVRVKPKVCANQCDKCINEIIEHHKKYANPKNPQKKN